MSCQYQYSYMFCTSMKDAAMPVTLFAQPDSVVFVDALELTQNSGMLHITRQSHAS